MNSLVRQFYRSAIGETSAFEEVYFLEKEKASFEELVQKAPNLPRGWFELCQLSVVDRIHFTCDFWLNQWTFHPKSYPMIRDFFHKLDDIQVVFSRLKKSDRWTVEMVYSLAKDQCFFRGLSPAAEEEWIEFKAGIGRDLPRDYLSFLRIHNGFGKLSELGLLSMERVRQAKRLFMQQLLMLENPLRCNGKLIDPSSLIPFYESFGTSSYQCFFADWYPGNEMGNVYLSGIDYTISDYKDRKEWTDQLAFPTFLEWFAFYLQGNNLE